jgi:F-type H+-transporting ATPase subunit epsilon
MATIPGIPQHLRLEFVTPERAIVHDDVDEVEVPGEAGYFGVLPGHAPTLAALQPGELWYRRGNEKYYAYVVRGFAEVLPDRVAILAQVAERAEDIDIQRAEAAKRRAEDRLARAQAADLDAERARIALIRSLGRLNVAQRARRH